MDRSAEVATGSTMIVNADISPLMVALGPE
jgi:hypothetical protein